MLRFTKRSIASLAVAAGLALGTGVSTPPAHAAVSAYASASTRLWTPGGRSAQVHKTWYSQGGGQYRGSWGTDSHSSGVTLYGSFDGFVGRVAWSGTYSGVAHFYLKACDSSGCSGWW